MRKDDKVKNEVYERRIKEELQKLDEDRLKEVIKVKPDLISYVPEPSEELIKLALKENPQIIELIDFVPERLQLFILKEYPSAFKFIKRPTYRVKLEAVKQNPYNIKLIKYPDLKTQLAAVKRNGRMIEYIKDPREIVILEAVKQNGNYIQYVENPSDEIKLAAVRQNGKSLKYIKRQPIFIQLEAARQNGKAIKYMKNLKTMTNNYFEIHKPERIKRRYIFTIPESGQEIEIVAVKENLDKILRMTKKYKGHYEIIHPIEFRHVYVLNDPDRKEPIFSVDNYKNMTADMFRWIINTVDGGLDNHPEWKAYLDIIDKCVEKFNPIGYKEEEDINEQRNQNNTANN